MGASPLMQIGVRAMAASYAQLQVTGHNVANASVEGYSRQRAELATAQSQFSGAGFFGKGVDVETVTRAHDAFLAREAVATNALAAMDRVRHEQLQRLEAAFPLGEQGIGHAAQQFFNAMVDLASRPQDASTREVVLGRARELASRFAFAGRQLETLQTGVTHDLRAQVAEVNQLAQRIAEVNDQIARVHGFGRPPNDLLDRRDALVRELAGYVQVTTIPASDGTLGVFVGGGQRLVLGTQAQALAVVADPDDTARSALVLREGGVDVPLAADRLAGGSIAGLLKFQNDDLARVRQSLDRMATDFAERVNGQHALGIDLDGNAGGALFGFAGAVEGAASMQVAFDDPRRLAAASPLVATWSAGPLGATRIAGLAMTGPVVDATLTAQIRFSNDFGAYDWELRDAGNAIVASGNAVWTPGETIALNGFALALAGLPATGDRIDVAAPLPQHLPANNGNALTLAALRDGAFVGGPPAQTIGDAYASALADVGVRVRGARTAADLSAAAAADAEQRRSAQAGVNLDEEAARLIQFQQAYQAAAKVLQVAQSVFDTLLQVAAR